MFYSNQRKYFKETVLLAVQYLKQLSTWKEWRHLGLQLKMYYRLTKF